MCSRKKIWGVTSFTLSVLFLLTVIAAMAAPLVLSAASGGETIAEVGSATSLSYNATTGNVVVGLRDNAIAVIGADGALKWQANVSSGVTYVATDGDYIAACMQDKSVVIFNNDGTIKAEFESYYTPDHMAIDSQRDLVVISAGMSAMKNNIQTFHLDGTPRDSQKIPTSCTGMVIDPNSGDIFYTTVNSRLYRLTEDNKTYSQTEYETTDLSIDLATGNLYTTDVNGTLYCFDTDLKQLWSVKLEDQALKVAYDVQTSTVAVLVKGDKIALVDNVGTQKYLLSTLAEAELLTSTEGGFVIASKTGTTETLQLAAVGFQNLLEKAQQLSFWMLPIALILLYIAAKYLKEDKWLAFKAGVREFFRILNKHKISYLFLLPTFVMLIVFNYFPAVWGFFLAFTDYLPGVYCKFVGFDNFIGLVQNEYFWIGIGNMLVFLVTDLLKALIPPILVAEFLIALRSSKMQYWARVLMYIPGILPGLAGLLIWTTGILGMGGLFNSLLDLVGLDYLITDWLGTESTALGALCYIGFPWVGSYIIMYGALRSVPSSLYEAAKLDGCGWWNRILRIDIPMISPQLKYIFVTSFIGSIQDFNRVYQTTMGGPGKSTYIPALELYLNISIFKDYGAASAMGILLFIVIFGATLMLLKMKTQDEMA